MLMLTRVAASCKLFAQSSTQAVSIPSLRPGTATASPVPRRLDAVRGRLWHMPWPGRNAGVRCGMSPSLASASSMGRISTLMAASSRRCLTRSGQVQIPWCNCGLPLRRFTSGLIDGFNINSEKEHGLDSNENCGRASVAAMCNLSCFAGIYCTWRTFSVGLLVSCKRD